MYPLSYHLSKWFGWNDPPYQTRLRGVVSKVFTPDVVMRMRPRIQTIVDELIDNVQSAGGMDVIRDIAHPLPVTVIAELLRVPPEYRERFKQGADDIVAFFSAGRAQPETAARAQRGILAINDSLKDIVHRRRSYPEHDLISRLLAIEQEGDLLSEEELIGTCVFFLVAGHETTTDLIGNCILALLENPDQMGRLRDEPSLIGSAVEEFLRYDSPVQRIWRLALQDCEIDGKRILKGQIVLPLIGAANRDPAQFLDPHRLDIGRRDNIHAAFGVGTHFCVGATLARTQGQIAIQTLLRRLPFFETRHHGHGMEPTMAIRSLKALPVTF